jgi:predicted TIM-barrel fold metal-dependent hydrolase
MIIDAHAHVFPEPVPIPEEFIEAASGYLLRTGIEVTHFGTPEDLLKGVKGLKIAKACLLPIAVAFNPETKLNNFISTTMRENPEMEGFASVNPNSPSAGEELERAVLDLGLRGLVLDPNNQKFKFSDDSLWYLLEKVKELEVPVAVHSDYSPETEALFFDPEEVNETIISFPDVTFIFPHMGRHRGKEDSPSIYPEENVLYDTSHSSASIVEEAVEGLGAEKIVYGSDFKYNFYPHYEIDKIQNLRVSKEEKEKILGENMARILKLPTKKERGLGQKVSDFLKRLG